MASDSDPKRHSKAPEHPLAKKRAGGTGPAKRPLPPGEQFFTPGATGLRRAVELKSGTPLVFLFQLPRWLVPVVMVVLMLVGVVVPDWRGALAVLPVLAFVLWLAYLSWPTLRIGGRVLRVALATFLILLAADRLGLI